MPSLLYLEILGLEGGGGAGSRGQEAAEEERERAGAARTIGGRH